MIHYIYERRIEGNLVQTTTRYPVIFRLLLGLGRIWLASLIMLILAPLINAYGLTFGIPLASHLAGVAVIAAVMVLFLSLPLSWGLSCAGLLLEWLSRHRHKPKRKTWAEDRRLLSVMAQRSTAQRLAVLRESRPETKLKSKDLDPRRRLGSETEARDQPDSRSNNN